MKSRLEALVRKHEADLRSRHPRVTTCRVSVEDRPPRSYERRRFNVRLDIGLAGHEIVVNREHDEDPGSALRAAFEAANQQLEIFASQAQPGTGQGKRWNLRFKYAACTAWRSPGTRGRPLTWLKRP